jgi:antitoxin component of RelBE/YafQ-DinJ toxin-antitoxin module
MKTPKSNRDEVRETTFTVTVTRSEKKAIQEAATKIGLTMSSWVRMIIGEKINQK